MRTEAVTIPFSAAMEREAERWKNSRKPRNIDKPGPGQVSVWSFPRPPAVERVLERVTIELAGVTLVDVDECLRVCETASPPTYYFHREEVDKDCLQPSAQNSYCEWKGRADYFDLVAGDTRRPQAAWWYPKTSHEYQVLEDHIAFYASRVDGCTVAGEVVRPQPGEFYAGWITSELVGPWKGEPGSQGW